MVRTRRLNNIFKSKRTTDPLRYLSPRRIDIAAKTAFVRAYIEDNKSTWPEKVYREHIRAFNGFQEKIPRKTNYEDFKYSFIETIEFIRDDTLDKSSAAVSVFGHDLLDGAHRIAASIVLNKSVLIKNERHTYNPNYGYAFFSSNRGNITKIDDNVLDYMTIEYVSLKKKNIFVAVIFPVAEGYRDVAHKHFQKLGEIINMKSFAHDEFVGKEVIKQLYNGTDDNWNKGIDFYGAERKAKECFNGVNDLQVYVIEANLDKTTMIKEKQYLRDLWRKDKHSIHITDTVEEANNVTRMFFNKNSRRVLKTDREQEFNSQETYLLFEKFSKGLPDNILEREKTAITGSVVFDLLNIRTAKDLDYISRDGSLNLKDEKIDRHDEFENVYHSTNIDELLSNPKYYFYYKGIKFVDILEMQRYKINRSKRGEKKDKNDIKLIKEFIKNNSQYSDSIKSMDNYPKVSVIVPVYNTDKKYLQACMTSIETQEYQNLEVIIVDDGSKKDIAEWIDKRVENLQSSDKNRKWEVIHQKNRGLSAARNTGYRVAKGKYIQFLDADDYFDKQLIKCAVEKAEKTNADVVVENYYIKDYENDAAYVAFREDTLPDSELFSLDDLSSNKLQTIPHNVWSKLFRRDFLEKHRVLHDEELYRAEDIPYTYSVLLKTKKISALFEPYIHYRRNLPNSNTKNNDKFPSVSVKSWAKLRDFMMKNGMYNDNKSDYEKAMLDSLKWHYDRMKTNKGKDVLVKESKRFLTEIGITANHDFRLIVELRVSAKELLPIFEEKIKTIEKYKADIAEMNSRLKTKDDKIRAQEAEITGIKKTARRLLINVLRRLKTTFS